MSSKRILIVDDDEGIREGLEALLVDEGYEVQSVANGQLALDKLRSGEALPSLILLDLMMPVMDGATFCEERAKSSELSSIPVIVLTAGAINEKVQALRVAERLRKPLDIDQLLEIVRRHMC